MAGTVDLHLHTTFSDGAHTAENVIALAAKAGLTVIGITDHDHVGAIDHAQRVARHAGIEVIPGVELSTSVDDLDVHILGYYVDTHNPTLLEYLAYYRGERVKRAERIVQKLNVLKIPLAWESVTFQAGSGAIGRPHIAHALVEKGLVDTYHEAFARFIGNGKPAYERKVRVVPEETFEVIAVAGGLSFVAHPGSTVPEDVLRELINEGVDGIEVIHPSHSTERTRYYRSIAQEYYLLTSGGSDFHGGGRNDVAALGRFTISDEELAAIRRAAASSNEIGFPR
jgi:predicted metal-dependent phosphoesterase TrpH